MDSFFNGFGEELLKLAGPVDWAKKKLGIGKPPKVEPVKTEPVKTEPPKKDIYRPMGSQQKGLKAEGVFGANR